MYNLSIWSSDHKPLAECDSRFLFWLELVALVFTNYAFGHPIVCFYRKSDKNSWRVIKITQGGNKVEKAVWDK